MKKSFTTTLVLAGTLGVLLLWYFFYEQSVRPNRQKAEEKAKHVVQLDQNAIVEIEIERSKDLADNKNTKDKGKTPEIKPTTPGAFEKIKLKKSGSDWHLVEPVEDEADNSNVQSLVSTIATTESDRTVEENPKDLEPFGLKSPVIKIRIRRDAATPVTQINIGRDTPVGYSVYAQIGGKPSVILAGKAIKTTFSKSLLDLRNKKVTSVPRSEASEIEIQNQHETFLVKKDKNDNWMLARTNIPTESSSGTRLWMPS